MNNLARIKKLTGCAKQIFGDDPLVSVCLIGSMARNETGTSESDVDLIIFVGSNLIDPKYFMLTSKFRRKAKSIFKMPISLQVITPLDLQTIIAPTLLPGYIRDRVIILGADIRDKLREQLVKYTPREKNLASLKRILFERYHLRELLTILALPRRSDTTKEETLINKRAMFIMKELSSITGLAPDRALKRLGLNNCALKLPISRRDLKSRKFISAVSRLVDQLVLALINYLRRNGSISLDVW